MKILITGVAGFIGMHVANALLRRGDTVIGIDNLNDYYDVQLKQDRLKNILTHDNFSFIEADISAREEIENLFKQHDFQCVFNSAAQAGVRNSLIDPHTYVDSNLVGFINLLEGCRHKQIEHLVYVSSSSVYGSNTRIPFSVHDNTDHPVSLYAATKKSNELMAHTYSHLFALPTTGLRLFTVYGPWGRPDMSPSLFTGAILRGEPIDIYNDGEMLRDFTYIDDIVDGVISAIDSVPAANPDIDTSMPDPATSHAPYALYNLGHHEPVQLMAFINTIEHALGKKAGKNMLAMQPGDMVATFADIDSSTRDLDFKPTTSLTEGIGKFVSWYRSYYGYD